MWTDSGIKSRISVRELISIKKKKKKKAQAGSEWSNILPKFSQARKKPPPPPQHKKNLHFSFDLTQIYSSFNFTLTVYSTSLLILSQFNLHWQFTVFLYWFYPRFNIIFLLLILLWFNSSLPSTVYFTLIHLKFTKHCWFYTDLAVYTAMPILHWCHVSLLGAVNFTFDFCEFPH